MLSLVDTAKKALAPISSHFGIDEGDDLAMKEVIESNPVARAFLRGECTIKEARFILAYVKNGCNPQKAYIEAGYSYSNEYNARKAGQEIMRRPRIRQILAGFVAVSGLTAMEVLEHYRDVATTSMEDFIDVDEDGNARISFEKAKAHGKLSAIKKIRQEASGAFNIELRDQDKALDALAKINGLFVLDNSQKVSPQVAAIVAMTKEDRAEAFQHIAEKMNWDE